MHVGPSALLDADGLCVGVNASCSFHPTAVGSLDHWMFPLFYETLGSWLVTNSTNQAQHMRNELTRTATSA